MTKRKLIRLISWPDPLIQERLEDMAFFYDKPSKSWVRFADDEEVSAIAEWLKRHHLRHQTTHATGEGELKKHPKLSDLLVLKNGGSPTSCALCGSQNIPCRQWIEGDDADSIEYPNPAKFYLCGQCVQTRMAQHPRLYSPAASSL